MEERDKRLTLKDISYTILDFIYPRYCNVCETLLDTDEIHICAKCLDDMPLSYHWSWRDNPAEEILWIRTNYDSVSTLFLYKREANYKYLLHNLKYKGKRDIGLYLGEILGKKMKPFHQNIEIIIPVPLHPFRKFTRGYNQAEAIAIGIQKGLSNGYQGIDFVKKAEDSSHTDGATYSQKPQLITGCLIRGKYNKSQTKTSIGNKWEHLKDSFEVKNPKLL